MKKLLFILAVAIVTVIAYSQSKEASVAVAATPTLAAETVRATSMEVFLSGTNTGAATVNVEAWGDGQVIRRKGHSISKAEMTAWYANGSTESDLTDIAVQALETSKK